jgi:hypothetical protein
VKLAYETKECCVDMRFIHVHRILCADTDSLFHSIPYPTTGIFGYFYASPTHINICSYLNLYLFSDPADSHTHIYPFSHPESQPDPHPHTRSASRSSHPA